METNLAFPPPSHLRCEQQLLLADFLLPTQPTAMKKKSANIRTIGYEQSDLARFTERLAAAGVDLIVDVRAVPLSRKPGFSKNQLATALAAKQVEYKHVVRLGAPRRVRDDLRADGDWSRYVRGYLAHLDGCDAEIQALLDLAAERTICLLCFERDPLVCHRSLITARMAEKQPGLVVDHLCC